MPKFIPAGFETTATERESFSHDAVPARQPPPRLTVPARRRRCICRAVATAFLIFAAAVAQPWTLLAQDYERLSPFTRVTFDQDHVEVEYEGRPYELVAVQGVSTTGLSTFCSEFYGDAWQVAMATRFVEVLTRMGHRPGDAMVVEDGATVTLQLRDKASGQVQTVDAARLERGHHRKLRPQYASLEQEVRRREYDRWDPNGWQASPFTRIEVSEDALMVQFDGRDYRLLSIGGLSAQDLLRHARSKWRGLADDKLRGSLGQLLRELNHPPGPHVCLDLQDPENGDRRAVERAPINRENRDRAVSVRFAEEAKAEGARKSKAAEPLRKLTVPEVMHRLVDEFEEALDRWAYRDVSQADFAGTLAAIRTRIDQGLSPDDVTIELRKVIAMGVDGHASTRTRLTDGYLPFRLGVTGDRLVAFRFDRSDFVVPGHPFVHSIDGRNVKDWIEAARPLAIKGSPALVQSQLANHYLLCVQYLRAQIGLEQTPTVEVEFLSADDRNGIKRTFAVADRLPIVDDRWPLALHKYQGAPYRAMGDLGYLRLDGMYGEPKASVLVDEAMSRFRTTRGLIVDVRGNTGGSTDVLHAFLPYLMSTNEPPEIVMAAKYRLGSDYDPDHPGWLLRAGSPEWNVGEREAIERFRATFTPEWTPPETQFSEWYFEIASRADNPNAYVYEQPVVVLQDDQCFSATDVLLSTLKGRPNVTLMGIPSAGGSGEPATCELCADWWCRLSTHVGFQTNGQLFDGRGVHPDVLLEPTPEFFIGRRDNLLDLAIQRLNTNRVEQSAHRLSR